METTPNQHSESVRSLAGIGMSEQDIAAQLKISVKKLQKIHKRDLREGAAEGNRQVLEALHKSAISGNNMAAASLWVKARCGWRDTGAAPQSATIIRSKLIIGSTQDSCEPTAT